MLLNRIGAARVDVNCIGLSVCIGLHWSVPNLADRPYPLSITPQNFPLVARPEAIPEVIHPAPEP